MKYKVGDRVRIVSEVPEREYWANNARAWLGKVVTIREVLENTKTYLLNEADGQWWESGIAGLVTDEKSSRKDILDAAKNTVCQDRQDQYGSPEDNFALIAEHWASYIKRKCVSPGAYVDICPEDVAVMMIYLKTARIATGASKADNWVDIAGYAACGGEIQCCSEG